MKKLVSASMLVVDDDKIMRMVSQRLYGEAFQLDLAYNGQEALSILHEKQFEVILTDIHMPLMDGISFTRALRQLNNDNKNAIVIGITAHNDCDVHHEARQAGMDAVFAKPVKRDIILNTIQDLLSKQ